MTTLRPPVRLFLMALAVSVAGAAAARAEDAAAEEQAAITKRAQAFVEAYHKGDARALAEFWMPDGDYTGVAGRVLKGRQAITDDFTQLFADNKGMKLRIDVTSVRFPTPDTAIEDGVTSVIPADGGVANRARYTNLLVKKDGQWLISSVRESAYVEPTQYEHLRQLEWIIGEWVEDTKEASAARVFFEWTPDQNFIVGARAVGVKDELLDNGTLRIGWDPAEKLIRAWSFESDGGFAHGAWKKDGEKWVITMSAVLRNGSLVTATTVVTHIDPDTITWQVKDQQLDGKALADPPVIKMKRT
jgi:uncharacterized protein (TIGR02246 family)